MNRWRNYGLWVAIFAFIPLLCEAMGMNVLPPNYTEVYTAFLGILVMAGIINNPDSENRGFKDDERIKVGGSE